MNEKTQTTDPPAEAPATEMNAERALAWIDDVLEELGHALAACAETGANEGLVSAKINGFVMRLMSEQPNLAARASAADHAAAATNLTLGIRQARG